MDELDAMDDEALASVSDFQVEVEGLGSVRFHEPVDLRGADLDAVFKFSRHSVDVYSDEQTKPAPGTKLNHPCTISIEGCFPRRSDTASLARYRAKLEATTANFGGKNCQYDPVTGQWAFDLEHF